MSASVLHARFSAASPDSGREGRTIAKFDLALVESARRGDRSALEALLRATRPFIRRQAERRCIEYAEDATQEAMWTMYNKLATLRSTAAFPGWLARIVARICYGLVSPLWRRIEELKEADTRAAAEAVPIELRLDLAGAVDALPDTYREAMLMHYYEDMPVTDIAARIGITEGATKVRLHRGREQVRAHLNAGEVLS